MEKVKYYDLYKAFTKGQQIKRLGHSVEYNPYRHKGSADEFECFVAGWNVG